VVYLATGRNFPDALSAGAEAVRNGGAVLLVDGERELLDPASLSALQGLAPARVVVAGGASAVSEGILSHLMHSVSPTTIRLGGADRVETSALIAQADRPWGSAPHAYLATAWNFPDALVAATVAGRHGAPLYVVEGVNCMTRSTQNSQRALGVTGYTFVGGERAISENVVTCMWSALP
jgi:putative cell wall-binding protein